MPPPPSTDSTKKNPFFVSTRPVSITPLNQKFNWQSSPCFSTTISTREIFIYQRTICFLTITNAKGKFNLYYSQKAKPASPLPPQSTTFDSTRPVSITPPNQNLTGRATHAFSTPSPQGKYSATKEPSASLLPPPQRENSTATTRQNIKSVFPVPPPPPQKKNATSPAIQQKFSYFITTSIYHCGRTSSKE
ncbi:unnamed protein product [Orchesella dallaii]|uniref:Uncharacterized protein n=1 Tax=Orchesella dallaii TaxID=48710 RepID=A0ABP1PKL7_9HEXA